MVAIVQQKQIAAATDTSLTLDDAPTDDNLLVAVLASKQRGATPTMTSPGYTLLAFAHADDPANNGDGDIAIYGKVVNGDSATVEREPTSSRIQMRVYELSDASLDNVTVLSATDQSGGDSGSPVTMTVGTFEGATGIAIAVATSTRSSDQQGMTRDITDDGDWTIRFQNYVDPSAFGQPWCYFGDAAPSDDDLAATWVHDETLGGQGVHEWAMAAVLFGDAPPDPVAGVFLDVDGDEAFDPEGTDNVSADVVSWTIRRGAGPELTGSSQPGSATVVLQNAVPQASEDDLYNPYNESGSYFGFLKDGMRIWIGPNSDGLLTGNDPRGLFGGRVTDITPIPAGGTSAAPTVEFQCEDMLGWARRKDVRLDFEEGRAHDVLRSAVLASAGETLYDLAHEIHTMPLSHADSDLASVLDALNGATGTRHFAKPADLYAHWFRYTTRNRFWRTDATSDASLSASADHVTGTDGWRLSADTVTNRQKATVTPIVFTPATFTVWQAETLPVELTEDRPYSRIVEFDDVVRDPVLDIASTGDTVISSFTPFAEAAKIELSVAPGDAATVTQLSVEGRLARRLLAESHEANNTTSQDFPRGVRVGGELSSEYIGVIATARGLAEHVVWRFGNPQLRPTLTVTNWLPEQFELDLYDVIAFTSTQLKMDARLFEIVGLTHEGRHAATGVIEHLTTYVLQECRAQTDPGWFTLDSSELDGSDVLHY